MFIHLCFGIVLTSSLAGKILPVPCDSSLQFLCEDHFNQANFFQVELTSFICFQCSKAKKMAYQADNLNSRIAHNADQRPLHPVRDYGIVLVGQTGSGKSSTGNTILGRNAFDASPSGQSVTSVSSYATSKYGERTITVVDTPGVHDNVRSDSIVKQENARIAFLLREGVHCFVICMNASETRVTEKTKVFLDQVKVSGHVDFFDYCMLVYTKAETELCDISLKEFVEKQKENADMRSFLEKIGNRVLAVNNKVTDRGEKERNRDAIIAMVDTVIQDNIIKHKPVVFTNDTFKKAKELRENVVSVVQIENFHPSLVNAVIEADIWFAKLGYVAENEFVDKVITILCKSDQCEKDEEDEDGDLVFRNDEEVTRIPVIDCKEHIRIIYQATTSHINVLYQNLETVHNYNKTFLLTAGAATVGAGLFAGMSGMVAVGAILGVPAVIAYTIGE